MCLTQIHQHAECRHIKKTHDYVCDSGTSPSGNCLQDDSPPFRSELLATPDYCEECCIEAEAQLYAPIDAEARELEVDIEHLRELLELTFRKHSTEMQELQNIFVGAKQERTEEGTEEETIRLLGEQKKWKELRKRHDGIEKELFGWIQHAKRDLRENRDRRQSALGNFRRMHGIVAA